MFSIGPWQLAIVVIAICVLFPGRLHAAARGLGESIGLFRRAVECPEED